MVSIVAFQAVDPSSILSHRILFLNLKVINHYWSSCCHSVKDKLLSKIYFTDKGGHIFALLRALPGSYDLSGCR